MGTARLPRDLHPVAWWGWALGLAAAASFTTNPVLLLLIVGVAATAVALRDFWHYDARTDRHAVAERELRRAAGEAVD